MTSLVSKELVPSITLSGTSRRSESGARIPITAAGNFTGGGFEEGNLGIPATRARFSQSGALGQERITRENELVNRYR